MKSPLLLFCLASSLAAPAWTAPAGDFDWHSRKDQQSMHLAFTNTARICAALFGFTLRPAASSDVMVDKMDAYLLLRDDPEGDVASWALDIVAPANAIMKDAKDGPLPGDREAAAAAVAASEDPSVYDQAKARFMENAMRPTNAALVACSTGARDPFIGANYWTGSGSAEKQERQTAEYFSELVDQLKTEP